jgi:hypothetical protein
MKPAVRIMAFTLLGLTLAWAAPPLLFPFRSAFTIGFLAEPPARIASGFYGVEQTPEGLTYAWTGETFAVAFPGLDRRARWQLTLRVAASRADGTQPTLVATVNGVGAARATLPANGFVDYTVAIEPQSPAPRTTTVAFRVTPTFVPGSEDKRTLGAQVDAVRIAPDRWWVRSGVSLRPALVLGAAAGFLVGALGVPALAGGTLLVLFAAMLGLTLTQGFAAYLPVSWHLPLTGAAIAAVAAFFMLGRHRPGASVVAVITFIAVSIQLLLLSHPDMPLGDAIFQAHRFQDVLGGRYYFTSIAPGNYQFPYPIGLYVASLPFSGLAHGELQNAALLRVVVVTASGIAAALLYCPVLRWRENQVAAVSAVVAYHLLPLGFDVTATGNLTNMFGQALAMFAFAMAAGDVARGRPWQVAIFIAIAAAAMLSHTSTFAVLTVQIVLASVAVLAMRGRAGRRTAMVLLGAAVVAVAIALAVYYAHFGDVYRETWTRITAETGRANEATGGRTPLVRLLDVPRLLELSYGWPLLILAAIGAAATVFGQLRPPAVQAAHDADLPVAPQAVPSVESEAAAPVPDIAAPVAPVIVGGWLAACLLFLVIGIVTPVDMRHLLAALPAVAVLAAVGFQSGWRGAVWQRLAVVLLVAWAASRAASGLLARLQ